MEIAAHRSEKLKGAKPLLSKEALYILNTTGKLVEVVLRKLPHNEMFTLRNRHPIRKHACLKDIETCLQTLLSTGMYRRLKHVLT